jgi:hypothetical protein
MVNVLYRPFLMCDRAIGLGNVGGRIALSSLIKIVPIYHLSHLCPHEYACNESDNLYLDSPGEHNLSYFS